MKAAVATENGLAVRDISDVTTDMRGSRRIGATATTSIKRSDYGMTWNKALEAGGVLVSEEVSVVLDVELVKQTSAGKPASP